LAAIIEEGGFERAAQRLHVTQSAVSQRLRALETQIGVVLVVRSRPVQLTAAGHLLLKHTRLMRLLRADLERDLKELAPGLGSSAGEDERIAIAINADSIATWALPALDALTLDGQAFEVIADDQDFTHEWLRSGQVLGCVTTVSQALRGCRVVALGSMPYVAVAAPDYANSHCPDGITPANFRRLLFVAFNRKDDLQAEFVGQAVGLSQVAVRQSFVPSSDGQVRAAMAGWGATVVPELLVREHLQQGRLVNIAPEHVRPVALYWHCWKLESQLLDALSHALTSAARVSLKPST